MNINDDPEALKAEEQSVLNSLISRMDQVIGRLDQEARNFVAEAKNAIISQNPDEYISLLLARKGIKDNAESRKRLFQARDELYQYRLLLQCKDSAGTTFEELKVGLHSCMNGAEPFVISWTMPLCRHYLLDNSSVEFENIVTDRFGEQHHTFFTLLVKNEVKLRFTRVTGAVNFFPGIMDDNALTALKRTRFFSDAFLDNMMAQFDPDRCGPDDAAKIISDEFLLELLERRSDPELKNIVFSIQKKQGEIIQAKYDRNMVVQGCAGSGKSMIMLHRLPILLYDNPTSMSRTNIYVISPSQMYIQLAENMRHQLEISDINMGTIEQYYDHCIGKYPGCKPQDYGKVNHGRRVSNEDEQYIFSLQCINDMQGFFDELFGKSKLPLENACSILSITEGPQRAEETYFQRINSRLLKLESILRANEAILVRYYHEISKTADALNSLSAVLRNRKVNTLREIARKISRSMGELDRARLDLEKLEPVQNAAAIENRKKIIEAERKQIGILTAEKRAVEADGDYFASLLRINEKLESAVAPFQAAKSEYSQNSADVIYGMIDQTGVLTGAFFTLSRELSKAEDKYAPYLGAIMLDVEKAAQSVAALQAATDRYLDLEYYEKIREEHDTLADYHSNAIKKAYEFIMDKIGCAPGKSGSIRAIKYSPYIYLQIIYQFRGAPPSGSKESLLAIDEAQGLAPEEVRLLRGVNGNHVIMNLYGDVYQHIEGTKGISSWDDFRGILDFDLYEMQENYRNASQITRYCNRIFGMNMIAINTPGKGVHEIASDEEFYSEMMHHLLDSQRAGMGAILVGDDKEAKYLIDRFADYEQKFHDMTSQESSVHHTRWNILNINDAKGLEFSSVFALSGRMGRSQRYIAYTRALDDLYVYSEPVDLSKYSGKDSSDCSGEKSPEPPMPPKPPSIRSSGMIHNDVRKFFEDRGISVIDERPEGGRLWAIGEKESIRGVVNEAVARFNISGKYMSGKESSRKNGWCTKTGK